MCVSVCECGYLCVWVWVSMCVGVYACGCGCVCVCVGGVGVGVYECGCGCLCVGVGLKCVGVRGRRARGYVFWCDDLLFVVVVAFLFVCLFLLCFVLF